MAEPAKSAEASDQDLEKWYADETARGKTDRQFGEILVGLMCEDYERLLKERKEDPATIPKKVSDLRDALSYRWNMKRGPIYHATLGSRALYSPAERIRKLYKEFDELVTTKKEFPTFVKTSETAPDEQLQAWYDAKKKEGLTERQIGNLIIEPMCANYEAALRAADAAALAQEADRWFHPMGRYEPFFGEHGRGMGPIIVENFKSELSIYWNFQSKDEPAPKRMRRLYRQYEYVISGEKDRREMIGMALMGEWLPIASYKPPAGGGRTPGPTSGNTGPGGKGGSSGQRLPGPEGTGGKGTGTGVKQGAQPLEEILVGPKGAGGTKSAGGGSGKPAPAATPAPPKTSSQATGKPKMSRYGDLTAEELAKLQRVARETGKPVDVVGSAAKGTRRGVGEDLPLGKGPGTKSDLDIRIDGWDDATTGGKVSDTIYREFPKGQNVDRVLTGDPYPGAPRITIHPDGSVTTSGNVPIGGQ